MKALITGSEGFVGKYLRKELNSNGYDVIGLDVIDGEDCIKVNLLNEEDTSKVVAEIKPDVIFHLAGQADVGKSWREPALTFKLNVIGTINLMEAARISDPSVRIVLIGSSDEYGVLGEKGSSVSEETYVKPVTPYAISKVAQENLARTYVNHYGMNVFMTRSFNHAGAGQKKGFMISDFASGIAEIEAGNRQYLEVGNLESARDFTHVADIATAYRLIAEKGTPGETYNVGSGNAYKANDVLNMMISMAKVPIEVRQNSDRMRPSDTPVVRCDNSKLKRDTGWEPKKSIEDITRDALQYWRNI